MKIKKAVFPIADKPLLQYAAKEAFAVGIDALIFVTGQNKRAIKDHLGGNNQLETIPRAKGKDAQAVMVRNTIPEGAKCICMHQAELLGLGHADLCVECAVGGDPFAEFTADDFQTDYKPGVIVNLVQAYASSGKSQLSVVASGMPDVY